MKDFLGGAIYRLGSRRAMPVRQLKSTEKKVRDFKPSKNDAVIRYMMVKDPCGYTSKKHYRLRPALPAVGF